MIRVLHTESSMNLGGQELRVLLEMERMAERGFESTLAARPGSRIFDEAKRRGLEAYPVRMHGSFDPLAVAELLRIILRERIDIVSAHGSKDGWSAGIAARLSGRKIIRSRHIANPIRGHFMGRVVYGALCDRIVTTSESIKTGMVEKGVPAEKIISIPTGVDTTLFDNEREKGRFRSECGISPDVFLVGMVSVLRGDKGPDVFVKAAGNILGKSNDIYFTLVGDGSMSGKIKDMVSGMNDKERFVLAGYRRDIPDIMADLDVLCLPARSPEGVPQVILQAHAMRVPVIASDIGGINEVALPALTALSIPPGDDNALATAIWELYANREKGRFLAGNGRKMVEERYTLEYMLDRMERVYRETLKYPDLL